MQEQSNKKKREETRDRTKEKEGKQQQRGGADGRCCRRFRGHAATVRVCIFVRRSGHTDRLDDSLPENLFWRHACSRDRDALDPLLFLFFFVTAKNRPATRTQLWPRFASGRGDQSGRGRWWQEYSTEYYLLATGSRSRYDRSIRSRPIGGTRPIPSLPIRSVTLCEKLLPFSSSRVEPLFPLHVCV